MCTRVWGALKKLLHLDLEIRIYWGVGISRSPSAVQRARIYSSVSGFVCYHLRF